MSALPRLLSCDGSLVLPKAETHSVWAESGNDEHGDLAVQVVDGTLPEKFAKLVPAGARPEVKVAFDVATGLGRIIGEGDGRDYGSIGPFEIAGSVDVLGVDGDTVVILDWKTGYLDVDPAERNWQMFGYALAACRALGKSAARIHIVYTKTSRVDSVELDAMDLAQFATRLAQLHVREAKLSEARKRGEIVSTREGSWCKHCASKSVCPSKNALLVQIGAQGLAVVGDSVMTPEKAAAGYEQIVRLEQLVKDARARLNAYVDEQGAIDLGNGRMFGRYHRAGNKVLDGRAAQVAIREIGGENAKEMESIAIELSTSQAAIERAVKKFAPPRGGAKMKAAIVTRIEELGGVTYGKETMPIGEFSVEKNKPASMQEVAEEANRLLAATG